MLKNFRKFICFILTFSIVFTQLVKPATAIETSLVLSKVNSSNLGITNSNYFANTYPHHTITHHPTVHTPTVYHTHPNHPNHPTTTHPPYSEHHINPNHPATGHPYTIHPMPHHETFYPRDIPGGLKSLNVVCIGPNSSEANASLEANYKIPMNEIGGKLAGGRKTYRGGGCLSSIQMDTQYQKVKIAADVFKDFKQIANFGIGAVVVSQLIGAYANVKQQSIAEGKPLDPCKPVALHIDGDKNFYEVYDSNNCSVGSS